MQGRASIAARGKGLEKCFPVSLGVGGREGTHAHLRKIPSRDECGMLGRAAESRPLVKEVTNYDDPRARRLEDQKDSGVVIPFASLARDGERHPAAPVSPHPAAGPRTHHHPRSNTSRKAPWTRMAAPNPQASRSRRVNRITPVTR